MREKGIFFLFILVGIICFTPDNIVYGFTVQNVNGEYVEHNSSGPFLHWDLDKNKPDVIEDGKVLFWMNQNGSDDISNKAILETALQEAAQVWQAPLTTSFKIEYAGQTDKLVPIIFDNKKYLAGADGINTVMWDEKGKYFNDKVCPRSWLACTPIFRDTNTGEIFEADIVVNGTTMNLIGFGKVGNLFPFKIKWTVADEQYVSIKTRTWVVNVQAMLAHEFGHFLGLGHSADSEATMYGIADWDNTKKRTLEADDIAGVSFLYPNCGSETEPPVILNTNFINNGDSITMSTTVNINIKARDNCGLKKLCIVGGLLNGDTSNDNFVTMMNGIRLANGENAYILDGSKSCDINIQFSEFISLVPPVDGNTLYVSIRLWDTSTTNSGWGNATQATDQITYRTPGKTENNP